ncbi:MAG: efflux RND transporter periplasmic adaptor subunit [Candidatus Dadabacteria bacterium]|nr:MAG: efflux RND transporter periplasmic adaptor subunit [Candidatus Dadabacteria bacterium]TDJ02020.1 MAG: efflux RND transporter periplasmic adaptor subunit [Candidatus Dadabacteria bacterium]
MNLKNTKVYIALLIIIVIAIFLVPRFFGDSTSSIVYVTAEVDRNNITSLITSSGTINPLKTIEVGSLVSGYAKNIFVDYNTEVKKGDPLLEIDPSTLGTELKRAQADKKKADADFNLTNSVYNANRELYDKRLISKEEFDDSRSKYLSALASLDQSKATIEITESNLRNTTIRSPIDGIVLSRNINTGENVVPNSKPLFLISQDLSSMRIDTNVSEADIGKIQNGQRAFFTVDAYPNQTFEGVVSQIRNEPITNNNVVTYNVVVSIGNKEDKLKPGMTAEVKITVAEEKDVKRVPTSALRFIPPSSANIESNSVETNNSPHVWVLGKNGQIKAVLVKPGVGDSRYTEIAEGDLKEGDEVIVEAIIKNNSGNNSSYLPQPRRF